MRNFFGGDLGHRRVLWSSHEPRRQCSHGCLGKVVIHYWLSPYHCSGWFCSFLENALKVAIVCCTSICSCPVPRSRSNSIFNSPSNVLKMKLCLGQVLIGFLMIENSTFSFRSGCCYGAFSLPRFSRWSWGSGDKKSHFFIWSTRIVEHSLKLWLSYNYHHHIQLNHN